MAKNADQNPGCLSAIMNMFGGKPEYSVKKTDKPEYTVIQTGPPGPEEDLAEELPYRVRDDYLSPAELSLYHVLLQVVKDNAVISSKVRLADVFFVTEPNKNFSYFNRISAKHIDFLLCQPGTMRPLLGIELDDASHQRTNRQERDEFVTAVFEAANLPLIHLPTQRQYRTSELLDLLSQYLDIPAENQPLSSPIKQPAANVSAAGGASSSIPVCPKCGTPMVLRTIKQGDHAGKQFYGCKNYPHCREMAPYHA